MKKEKFGGDVKAGTSLVSAPQKWLAGKIIPIIPKFIETYHLTWMTLVWSILVVLFGWLATTNLHWLWGVSAMIFCQYVTDLLDGKLGKYRNTGLIKWGYYVDHFLDYIFYCSIIIAYMFIVPDALKYLIFFVFAVLGAFVVNSYLSFAATNEFRISYFKIGPTEVRLGFIIVNTLWIIFGSHYLKLTLPFALVAGLIVMCLIVYQTQKHMWKTDMRNKKAEEKGKS